MDTAVANRPVLVASGHLRFYGSILGNTGLGAHCNIFTHPTLKALTIENRPDSVDELEQLPLPTTPATTPLRELCVSGVELRTLAPVLAIPEGLRKLSVNFTSPTTNAFVRDYMQLCTAPIISAALDKHRATLQQLDFHHHCLNEFDWSQFKAVQFLRLHQDHIFSAYRVWAAPLHTLLPKTLVKLTIHGCDFTKGHTGVCVLEASLLHLLDELEADQLNSRLFYRLKNITLILGARSPQPDDAFKQRCADSHIAWPIRDSL